MQTQFYFHNVAESSHKLLIAYESFAFCQQNAIDRD